MSNFELSVEGQLKVLHSTLHWLSEEMDENIFRMYYEEHGDGLNHLMIVLS